MDTSQSPQFVAELNPLCICGATEVLPDKTIPTRDQDGGGVFNFLKCKNCHSYRVSPRPQLSDIGKFYPTAYRNHSQIQSPTNQKLLDFKTKLYRLWWTPETERVSPAKGLKRLSDAFTYFVKDKTPLAFSPPKLRSVFEIGAATGLDLLVFKAAGWKVAGCELSEQAVNIAQSYGLDVRVSTAEQLVLPSNTYGCVHLNNVFEHLHDPSMVLRKAYQALVLGGKIVIVIPNHNSLGARLFGAAWPGFDGPRHLWGFTPAGIKAALAINGFELERVTHMPAGIWSWSDCWVGARRTTFKKSMPQVVIKVLAVCMLAVGIAASFLSFGDTIRVVAVKNR
jgi:SAM-dependent methyltransferase